MIGDVGRRICAISTWKVNTPLQGAAAQQLPSRFSPLHSSSNTSGLSTCEFPIPRYPHHLLPPWPVPAHYYARSILAESPSTVSRFTAHSLVESLPAALRNERSTIGRPLDRRKPTTILQELGRRSFRTSSHWRDRDSERRIKGTESHKQVENALPNITEGGRPRNRPTITAKDETSLTTAQHLIDRLPNISTIHRPTKEELLAAATGFWSRLKVRFKWFSIRSARPFNADEIGAFVSWVLLGHVLWIILGTTTFFSLAILAVNTVFAQGKLSKLHSSKTTLNLARNIGSMGR